MDRQQLNQTFEMISTDESCKENIYKEILEKHRKRKGASKIKHKSAWTKMAVTAAALLVLLVPQTIFADEIKDFFTGFLARDENVEEYVRQNVYEDTDGHLRMAVREVLSDQKYTRVIISYEALDDEGRDWIKKFDINDYSHSDDVGVTDTGFPYTALSLTPSTLTSNSRGSRELKEFRTDSTLAVILEINADRVFNLTNNLTRADLSYPMTHEISRTTSLDISANMDVHEYKLIGDTNVNKYYDVSYVRLTNLSIIVYGNQKNMWTCEKNANGWYTQESLVPEEDYDLCRAKVTIHTKDGNAYDCSGGWQGGILTDDEGNVDTKNHRGADTTIMSASYSEDMVLGDDLKTTFVINPEDVTGITINGNYFTLEELN